MCMSWHSIIPLYLYLMWILSPYSYITLQNYSTRFWYLALAMLHHARVGPSPWCSFSLKFYLCPWVWKTGISLYSFPLWLMRAALYFMAVVGSVWMCVCHPSFDDGFCFVSHRVQNPQCKSLSASHSLLHAGSICFYLSIKLWNINWTPGSNELTSVPLFEGTCPQSHRFPQPFLKRTS